jgi:WD domain, G-beta repeat
MLTFFHSHDSRSDDPEAREVARASSRRQRTRPPPSGTQRAPRRSRSCAAMRAPSGPPPSCPDGSRIVTTSSDEIARVWDAACTTEIAVLRGHGNAVNSAAFSPDGARIVTASSGGSARIWEAASVAAHGRAPVRAHPRRIQVAEAAVEGQRPRRQSHSRLAGSTGGSADAPAPTNPTNDSTWFRRSIMSRPPH